jgi:hypothetical protein
MKYQIEVWGSGGNFGIGTISQEQYDFWTDDDNNEFLSAELNQFLEEDELEVPDNAKFEDHYSGYSDIANNSGVEKEFMMLSITSEDGDEIFNGEYADFVDQYDPEINSSERTIPDSDEVEGCYLLWMQKEEGTFFSGSIEVDKLDPAKFKFSELDIYGEVLIINAISYDDQILEHDSDNLESIEEEFMLLCNYE